MSRRDLIITEGTRLRAMAWLKNAPAGTRFTIKEPKRSLDQNSLMWALLTEVSRQVVHHGQRLSPEDWKLLFLAQLKAEMRMVPNLDNDGWVSLGRSSSDLSKVEFTDLIELIYAYGAAHGVTFHDGQGGGGANNAAPAVAA